MSLQVSRINKVYTYNSSTTSALSDVSLRLKHGEFGCIVGPSGCGKSTLLRLISGLETSNGGLIKRPVRIGYLFQDPALFPWLSAFENIAFGLRMAGMHHVDITKRVYQYLNLVGLSGFAGARPYQLSGGMRQRVALARSMVIEPDLLLMDEPFSAIDLKNKERFYDDIQEIWKRQKMTVLLVTHNIRESVCLGSRVFIMSGRPGTIKHVVAVPLNRPRKLDDLRVTIVSKRVKKLLYASA